METARELLIEEARRQYNEEGAVAVDLVARLGELGVIISELPEEWN